MGYIVCYALGIYILNLFLAFLQPKFDPSLAAEIAEDEVEEGAPGLPTSMSGTNGGGSGRSGDDDEFRPFIRRLPEFKFWHAATRAIVFSILATFFSAFDIPVFWPILLVYFCVLSPSQCAGRSLTCASTSTFRSTWAGKHGMASRAAPCSRRPPAYPPASRSLFSSI